MAGDEGGEGGHAAADYGDVDFDDTSMGVSRNRLVGVNWGGEERRERMLRQT